MTALPIGAIKGERRLCRILDCGIGLCSAHWDRLRRWGHPRRGVPIATPLSHNPPDCPTCGAGTNGYTLRGGVCAEWCWTQRFAAAERGAA